MPSISVVKTYDLVLKPTFRSLGRDFFEYQELLANQWFYARDACFTGAIG